MTLLYIDLFCGAGGTSTGVESARLDDEQCAKVIACVNHDANAIASHSANHPDALHFTEDIRTLELTPLIAHTKCMKTKYPDAMTVLWASLECTNFSNAKGGKARDADSRTLAEHLFRYVESIKPDFIQVENVQEFMSWGDIDENGKPISRDKGRLYGKWVNNVCRYGYNFDYRILNAADFGAYTSRKRFFGIFATKGFPIVFPEPTHAKKPIKDIFGRQLKKWRAVKDVLDFSDEGNSIFGRKKPLSEATLERIYCGLLKFVAGGKDKFLIKYNSMHNGVCNPPDIDEPCPTIAVQTRLGIASVNFLTKNYGGDPNYQNSSINEPAGTITTIDHHTFISACYGNGFNKGIDEPASTITTVPKLNIVSLEKAFLMNPQFKSDGGSIDDPCFALIASMNNRPPSIVNTKIGSDIVKIFPDDSPVTLKIKEFMIIYDITDIKIRMLKVCELKKIMGFPGGYVLKGNQSEQKKFIGNAVEVNMAKAMCEALCRKITEAEEFEKVG